MSIIKTGAVVYSYRFLPYDRQLDKLWLKKHFKIYRSNNEFALKHNHINDIKNRDCAE